MRPGWVTAAAGAIGLALGACGGGGDDTATPDTTAAVTQPTSAPGTTELPTTDATTDATTELPTTDATTELPTTDATTTVAPPETTSETAIPAEVVVFDLADLPEIVSGLEQSVAADDPLALATRLGGFPFDVPVPAGSTIARIDTVVSSAEGVSEHEFTYTAIAPGGAVPDIDIDLDDNGPGSLQVIEIWDPIMTDLGFERANSTASDPGDPGGPNSVNHVYVPTEGAPVTVNGQPATIGNVFVWSTEDVTGAASGLDPTDPVGGYRIDADAELDASGPIGVPLLASILELVPLPDGVVLDRATLRLETRSPDAYEVDRGVNYLSISFDWTAPAGTTVDELAAFYAEPAAFTTDDLVAAEPSFFEAGTYEPAEIAPYGDADRRLPLLLVRRYEGTLWVESPNDPAEPVTISYDVTLNPLDAELAPSPG